MKDIEELRKLSIAELQKELLSSSVDLFQHKIKVQAQEEKTIHMIKKIKKYIARIKTVESEKKVESFTSKNEDIAEVMSA